MSNRKIERKKYLFVEIDIQKQVIKAFFMKRRIKVWKKIHPLR